MVKGTPGDWVAGGREVVRPDTLTPCGPVIRIADSPTFDLRLPTSALGRALFPIRRRQLADMRSSFDPTKLHPGATPGLPLAPRLRLPPCQQAKLVRGAVSGDAVAAPCPAILDALHGDPRLQR